MVLSCGPISELGILLWLHLRNPSTQAAVSHLESACAAACVDASAISPLTLGGLFDDDPVRTPDVPCAQDDPEWHRADSDRFESEGEGELYEFGQVGQFCPAIADIFRTMNHLVCLNNPNPIIIEPSEFLSCCCGCCRLFVPLLLLLLLPSASGKLRRCCCGCL